MTRLLIADAVAPICSEILGRTCEVVTRTGLSEEELIEAVGDIDALVVRSSARVTERVLAAAPKLQVVGRAGAGVDTIDIAAATRQGVVVMNTPGGNSVSTAEHTIALLFALARNVVSSNRSLRSGRWDRKKFVGTELRNKVLGVIGLGKVGAEVARIARGLGMAVIGYDPYLPQDALAGVKRLELDEVFAQGDFVTLHTPLSAATENLVDERRIALMKTGARLINCARGGLLDEAAVAAALESGKLGGVAVDVYRQEPPETSPMFDLDQVVSTPHLGASTREAQVQVAEQIARQIDVFFRDGTIQNAVNTPNLGGAEAARIRPYAALTEQLASLATQLLDEPARALTLELHGEVTDLDGRPLMAAAAKGLLDRALANPVSIISAPLLAKERRVELRAVRTSEHDDFTDLVSVTVAGASRTHTVAGTLFGKKERRIVRVDGHPLDATASGPMLLISNRDRPGVVGLLGSMLADEGINIAAMSLARDRDEDEGDEAHVLLNLDSQVSEEICERLVGHDDIISARPLCL